MDKYAVRASLVFLDLGKGGEKRLTEYIRKKACGGLNQVYWNIDQFRGRCDLRARRCPSARILSLEARVQTLFAKAGVWTAATGIFRGGTYETTKDKNESRYAF